jgi:hypothetical protein
MSTQFEQCSPDLSACGAVCRSSLGVPCSHTAVGPTITRFEVDALSCWSSQVDESTLEALIPKLVQLIRSGVGLTTRAGVARFITMLTTVCCRSLHQQSG